MGYQNRLGYIIDGVLVKSGQSRDLKYSLLGFKEKQRLSMVQRKAGHAADKLKGETPPKKGMRLRPGSLYRDPM